MRYVLNAASIGPLYVQREMERMVKPAEVSSLQLSLHLLQADPLRVEC
jgi:hypothetical protein